MVIVTNVFVRGRRSAKDAVQPRGNGQTGRNAEALGCEPAVALTLANLAEAIVPLQAKKQTPPERLPVL